MISLASITICRLAVFFRCATNPTPQLSFSRFLSYNPCFAGNFSNDDNIRCACRDLRTCTAGPWTTAERAIRSISRVGSKIVTGGV